MNRNADLSKYKLVLAPDLSILPDETAAKLDAYVKNGGILLADCRTGVKDERNLCHARTLPGLLPRPRHSHRGVQPPARRLALQVTGPDRLSGTYTAIQYTDWITPETAAAVAGYADQWHLKPYAAVTRNTYGKGKAWYVGTVIKEPAFYDNLLAPTVERRRHSPRWSLRLPA